MTDARTSKEQFLADLDKAIAACKKTLTGRLGMSLEQFEAIRAFVATSHEPSCLACEDRPGPANDPCLVCGRSSHEPRNELPPCELRLAAQGLLAYGHCDPSEEGSEGYIAAWSRLDKTLRASQPLSDVDTLMSRVSMLVKSGDLELIVSDLDSPGDRRELRYKYSVTKETDGD
jgi:hypothetical protein